MYYAKFGSSFAEWQKKIPVMKLDAADKHILARLQEDARISAKHLAQELNLTVTPVYERIKKLEKSGLIRQYMARLNEDKIGLGLTAFCNVQLREHRKEGLAKFQKEVMHLEEVVSCWHVAGVFDYLLQVKVPHMEAYHHLINNKLATFENIGQVQSSFVMTHVKDDQILPLTHL